MAIFILNPLKNRALNKVINCFLKSTHVQLKVSVCVF